MADDEAEEQAEPAKRSFSQTVTGTVEGRSPGFLLGALALGMIIALLAGLAIGITIGNDDDTAAKPPTTTRPKPTPTTKPANAAALAKAPLVGTIVQNRPNASVITALKRRVVMAMVPKTAIEVTSAATPADIKAGSHVVFVLRKDAGAGATTGTASTTGGSGGRNLIATDILLVTGTGPGRIGTEVASATGDSMTFKTPAGKTVTVSTVGAKVLKTIPGAKVNLTAGRRVLAKTFLKKAQVPSKKKRALVPKRQFIAIEIIVLPKTSAFG